MKWIVKKETVFIQTVVRIFFLPHSRRVQRWNYEAVKKYHCIVAREKELPPPPSHHHSHAVYKKVEENSAVLDDISI